MSRNGGDASLHREEAAVPISVERMADAAMEAMHLCTAKRTRSTRFVLSTAGRNGGDASLHREDVIPVALDGPTTFEPQWRRCISAPRSTPAQMKAGLDVIEAAMEAMHLCTAKEVPAGWPELLDGAAMEAMHLCTAKF